jgi:hypothetical protein
MSSATPDYRYLTVRAAHAAGRVPSYEDARMQALYEVLCQRRGPLKEVSEAYDIYAIVEHRAVVDAFLLARVPPAVIAKVLEIDEPIVSAYGYLFMDRSVFRNKLELRSYAENYQASAYGRELIKAGVAVGPDYLLWTFGGNDVEVDTRYVVRRTMIDSFFRGMAHKGNALTSGVAKESQKWWSTAIRNAEILEKMDPRTTRDAIEELRIALEGKDHTYTTEQSPVPVEEILH